MFVKTEELGPIGGHAGHAPLDPPVIIFILNVQPLTLCCKSLQKRACIVVRYQESNIQKSFER